MMDQWLVLDINPEPWAIGPVGYARRGGKMSAYVGQNQQLNAYKEAIKEAVEGRIDMMHGKVDLTFYFWRNRAEYTTPQARAHRKHEADLTNLQKSTEDALQGLLYENDKDNSHVQSFMVEQGPDVQGMVVIHAYQADPFDEVMLPDHVWADITNIKTVKKLSIYREEDLSEDLPF